MTTAAELYKSGQLAEAIAAAGDEVKRHPADAARRGFLAELLCFAGDFDRADKQLDAIGASGPADGRGDQPVPATAPRRAGPAAVLRRRAAARVPRAAVAAPAAAPGGVDPAARRADRRRPPRCSTRPKQQRPAVPGACGGGPSTTSATSTT